MSDFSKLLGKLQTSVKRTVESSSHQSIDQISGRSGDGDRQFKRQKVAEKSEQSALPKDINQLTVPVKFLGIGCQKGGTSWLHRMLELHDNLSLPKYVLGYQLS